jgi:hypothetical protein
MDGNGLRRSINRYVAVVDVRYRCTGEIGQQWALVNFTDSIHDTHF